jgi:putative ABC transport system permease protein
VTGVALRGLAGRKLRAALTAFAIVLGVAMVSGTYVLTDTIDKAFSNLFEQTYADTDARVTGKSVDIGIEGETSAPPAVPDTTLADVRTVPAVATAAGTVVDDQTRLLDKHGKALTPDGPTFAFGIDFSPQAQRFNPTDLVAGRWPGGTGEVVIDAATADAEGYRVGERIGVAAAGPVQEFDIVGIAQYGGVDSLGSATFAVFDIPTAQALLRKEGELDGIFVAAKDGVSPEQLVHELEAALPTSVEVQTGTESAREESAETKELTDIIRYFLLSFAGIALFVGGFVIFNTLSITIAQRTRELATLRTIGASRRQVLGSVVLEALVIGFLAAVVGLGVGIGIAAGLKALFAAMGAELPEAGMVLAPRTVIVSLLVGVVVTVLAGLAPALRATRVPPIAAVREGAELPRSRFAAVTPYAGGATILLAVALLGYSLFADELGTAERLLSLVGGCLALFVGVALLSSRLVRPLVAALGWPAQRLGGAPGRLAQSNARRNVARTASTAAALMIGLALVTFVAVLANGTKSSNSKAIEAQVLSDYVVTGRDGYAPFVAAAGEAVSHARGARLATSVRTDVGKVAGSGGYVTGIEPATIAQAYRFDWKAGSDGALAELGRDGAIVADDFADEKHLRVGDRFELVTGAGERRMLAVKAIYEPPPFYPLLGSVSISQAAFDRLYERARNAFTFVNVGDDPRAHATLEAALADFPEAKIQTRADWIAQQDRDIEQFVQILYVLLALSVVVSLFGMVNTLALSVFERTRELGMLRAVGMTRRQARRMVRHESVITALIAAALGLPLGIFLAALVTRALSDYQLEFSVPVGQLVLFTAVASAVGVLAAVLPAWRASRLNVLKALQYE